MQEYYESWFSNSRRPEFYSPKMYVCVATGYNHGFTTTVTMRLLMRDLEAARNHFTAYLKNMGITNPSDFHVRLEG